MQREQHFAGIGDLAQPVFFHFIYPDFAGVAKAILDAAQDAIHVMPVALKLQYSIDDVLQHLRASNAALFVDVPYQYHGGVGLLGIAQECGSTFPHLAHTASRRLELVAGNRLD